MPVPSDSVIMEEYEPAPSPPIITMLKHNRDARDSISSTDSDVSLTYDGNCSSSEDSNSSPADEINTTNSSSDDVSKDLLSSDSEAAKDSGCEETVVTSSNAITTSVNKNKIISSASLDADDDDFVPPDAGLAARIVQQVEFYFSDVNITKDAFLLKHVKRNKEGYVSLKLISSFKRVKHLAKDWRVVAYAITNGSTMLQVNEAGTKLRRLTALPRYDDTAPSRTVVAFDLALEKPTIESVVDLFAPCGRIALVRILRPGNPVPADVRPFIVNLPDLAKVVCGLIEFEDSDGLKCAVTRRPACAQAAPLQWGNMRVVELIQKHGSSTATTQTTATNNAPVVKERKKRTPKPKPAIKRMQSDYYDSSCTSDAESFYDSRRRSSTSSVSSIRSLDNAFKILQQSPLAEFVNAPPWTPTRPRHIPPSLGARPRSLTAPNVFRTIPANVIRLPEGPDGTRGFHKRLQQIVRGRSASTPMYTTCISELKAY